jgi:hypothetical protein
MANNAKPLHQFRSGAISVSIWPQTTKDEKKVFYTANAQRAYTKDDGATWEHTDSFSRDDLPVVAFLMQQAWSFICRKEADAK